MMTFGVEPFLVICDVSSSASLLKFDGFQSGCINDGLFVFYNFFTGFDV